MNISFGDTSFSGRPYVDLDRIKQEFIKDCPDYKLFPNIDEFGNQTFNTIYPFIIMIIGIIIIIFTFMKSAPGVDDKGLPKERPYIIYISLFVLCILCVLFGLYGIYLYIYIYYPEYNKWLEKLTPKCKETHNTILHVQAIENERSRLLREQEKIMYRI